MGLRAPPTPVQGASHRERGEVQRRRGFIESMPLAGSWQPHGPRSCRPDRRHSPGGGNDTTACAYRAKRSVCKSKRQKRSRAEIGRCRFEYLLVAARAKAIWANHIPAACWRINVPVGKSPFKRLIRLVASEATAAAEMETRFTTFQTRSQSFRVDVAAGYNGS